MVECGYSNFESDPFTDVQFSAIRNIANMDEKIPLFPRILFISSQESIAAFGKIDDPARVPHLFSAKRDLL